MSSSASYIVHERNRFVAFAFAAADAFIELDRGGRIAFAGCAIPWLTGLDAEALAGRTLWDFVVEGDRMLIKAALAAPAGHGRFGPITVKFRHPGGQLVRAMLTGMCLPEDKERASDHHRRRWRG